MLPFVRPDSCSTSCPRASSASDTSDSLQTDIDFAPKGIGAKKVVCRSGYLRIRDINRTAISAGIPHCCAKWHYVRPHSEDRNRFAVAGNGHWERSEAGSDARDAGLPSMCRGPAGGQPGRGTFMQEEFDDPVASADDR